MGRFVRGELDVLVSTTVVEVGVDVANATVMVVLDAHRYGLAQLHQLRGRVGRGAERSYCILVYPDESGERERLEILTRSTDGFEIADEDLRLRGPGQLSGTMQSGAAAELRLADLVADVDVYRGAKTAAAGDRSPGSHARAAGARRAARGIGDAAQHARAAGVVVRVPVSRRE